MALGTRGAVEDDVGGAEAAVVLVVAGCCPGGGFEVPMVVTGAVPEVEVVEEVVVVVVAPSEPVRDGAELAVWAGGCEPVRGSWPTGGLATSWRITLAGSTATGDGVTADVTICTPAQLISVAAAVVPAHAKAAKLGRIRTTP